MKNIALIVFASTLLIISGCAKMKVESVEYIPTEGDSVTIVFSDQDSHPLRFTIDVFPKEIYLGDTIYIMIYHENVSTETIIENRSVEKQFSLSSTAIPKAYHWIKEDKSNMDRYYAAIIKDAQPGEKYLYGGACLEFPPLDDWNDPFWKELIAMIPEEGMVCKLHIKHEFYNYDLREPQSVDGDFNYKLREQRPMEIEFDILIKPRPANEMSLLNKWYKNTPKKLFPEVYGNSKIPHDMDLKSSGRSNIKIGWNSYDPWLFIRIGNRKPSDPNNPTTLDGWRKLEASLVPSTMRDEIRLTRLQLEYYSAKKGEASDNAKNELVEWLKSLPEVQRTIMTTFLVSKMYDFYQTSLREKNRELMHALYDLLDHGCQEAVCNFESINYKDRSLPPPTGVKVQRSMNEILEPTTEDLAHGSKDLPDGFRLWDAVGDTGPTKLVAQFVELKEKEDTLVIKHREGWNINLMFSALSEEDKQYAREQHKKKLTEEEAE